MTDQRDIPLLDESVSRLDSQMISDMAESGRSSLYYFSKAILGYRDITESFHGPLCEFLDRSPKRFRLVLVPRGTFKSSIGTISRSLHKIVRNPEERILLANESATNVERFLSTIQGHAESNRVFRTLYSNIIPPDFRKVRWNQSEAEFRRQGVYPEPSIDTIGMTGAFTSRHYTHITYDDPISIEAVKSPSVMTDTIARCHQALSLFVNPLTGTFDLIGTRWALADLYADFMEKFGEDMARYIRAVVEDGQLTFPERMTWEEIARLRRNYGEYLFTCLYMNNPRNEAVQTLSVGALREWRELADGRLVLLNNDEVHTIVQPRDLDITITFDPAAAETVTSDRNAITVCGTTREGDILVLFARAGRWSPLEVMEMLFALDSRYQPRVVGIEDVAYQKTFKVFWRAEMARRQHWVNVRPIKTGGKSKAYRVKGLQPAIVSGHLYLAPDQHELRQEMSDFPLGKYDDLVDALAMQPQIMLPHAGVARWSRLQHEQDKLAASVQRDMGHAPEDDEDAEPDYNIHEAMIA